MDDVILVVVVMLMIFGALKKLFERLAEKAQADGDEDEHYEASPEDIRAFLQSLGTAARGPAAPRRPAPRAAAQGLPPESVSAPPPAPPQAALDVLPLVSSERVSGAPVQLSRELPSAAKKRRRRRPAAPLQRVTRRVAAPPARTPEAGLSSRSSLRRVSLKQAVIWSEILGSPVSMRRARGPRRPVGR
jgi:hypothetical protein